MAISSCFRYRHSTTTISAHWTHHIGLYVGQKVGNDRAEEDTKEENEAWGEGLATAAAAIAAATHGPRRYRRRRESSLAAVELASLPVHVQCERGTGPVHRDTSTTTSGSMSTTGVATTTGLGMIDSPVIAPFNLPPAVRGRGKGGGRVLPSAKMSSQSTTTTTTTTSGTSGKLIGRPSEALILLLAVQQLLHEVLQQ